jgi:hypothetical protein
MIISYCRPFSGNDSRNEMKLPDLGKKALRELSSCEKKLHQMVMNDRNTLLAHSDSEAVDLKFIKTNIAGHIMLQPVRNWSMAPLNKVTLLAFNLLAEKLLSYVAVARNNLEDDIIQLLQESDLNNKNETENYGINPA